MDLLGANHVPKLHENEELEDPAHVARNVPRLVVNHGVKRITIPVLASAWIHTVKEAKVARFIFTLISVHFLRLYNEVLAKPDEKE